MACGLWTELILDTNFLLQNRPRDRVVVRLRMLMV